MEKETIQQIAALELEHAALEAKGDKILVVIYSTLAVMAALVTFWFAGLF